VATSDTSAESGDSDSLKPHPARSVDLIPFREALDLAQGGGKKHLMLGNGFSIALRGYPAKSSLSCKHLWQRTY